jgi:hypothetical protein
VVNLPIELNNELIEAVKDLAQRHYGDTTDASIGHVVEASLKIRLLCLELAEGSGSEIEEPMVNWEFADKQPSQQLPSGIREFLFKKGG